MTTTLERQVQMVRIGDRTFPTQGGEVIRFVEGLCVFTNGRWTGQPFRLLPWQKRLIYELFEIDVVSGRRRYRRALIGTPRKQGKTESAAALALYMMLGDGEQSSEVYCAAASEEQADRVFDAAKRMCELSPSLRQLVDIQVSRLSAREDPYSYIARLTSKGKTKHGLNIHGAILDELHAWGAGEQDELWQALNTGMAAREQPLQIAITTAGTDLDYSRCGELYRLGKQIESGEVKDASLFFRWWEAPADCDYRDPAMWRLANPSYGTTIDEGFYRDELVSNPETVFRRLYLNQWVESETVWLPVGAWDVCRGDGELEDGAATYVGWDASTHNDSTAVVWGQWSGDTMRVRSRIWERPLDTAGKPIESWTLPIAEVEEHVRDLCERYAVEGVAFDPAFITWSAGELEAQGLPMVKWPQTDGRMCPGTSALFDLIVQGRLEHDGDPVLARHIRSATAVQTRSASQRLTKGKARHKIDGAVALVMMTALAMPSAGDDAVSESQAFTFGLEDK